MAGARNGSGEVPDLSSLPAGDEMAGLWAQYHSALGLAKGKATPPAPRDQSVSGSVLFHSYYVFVWSPTEYQASVYLQQDV